MEQKFFAKYMREHIYELEMLISDSHVTCSHLHVFDDFQSLLLSSFLADRTINDCFQQFKNYRQKRLIQKMQSTRKLYS